MGKSDGKLRNIKLISVKSPARNGGAFLYTSGMFNGRKSV